MVNMDMYKNNAFNTLYYSNTEFNNEKIKVHYGYWLDSLFDANVTQCIMGFAHHHTDYSPLCVENGLTIVFKID